MGASTCGLSIQTDQRFAQRRDLLAQLPARNRRHDLREPVGLMVVAAVAHLLDQDEETIRKLIDRAEQAKPRSGRARYRAT
jgi:hypothetical protein